MAIRGLVREAQLAVEPERAAERAAEVAETARQVGVPAFIAWAILLQGEAAAVGGDLDGADRYFDEAIEAAAGVALTVEIGARLWRGLYCSPGDRKAALRSLHQAIDLGEEHALVPHLMAEAYEEIALAWLEDGKVEQAATLAMAVQRLRQAIGASGSLLHGFANEAVTTLDRARHQQIVGKQARGWTDLTTGVLAEAYLAVGQEQRAREMAEAPILVPDAWTNLLRARISQSRVFRALDGAAASERIAALLGDADRLVEKSGARAYAPLVAEEFARLAALGNDEQEARSQLRRALELYRDVGATGHVRRLSEEVGE